MDLTGLPIYEFRTLYRFIFQTANGYANSVKSRLVSVTDMRTTGSGVSGSPVPSADHGSLTGLGDDDHVQYYDQTRGDARYLQLTGGTLIGSLSGTAASFSGTASAGTFSGPLSGNATTATTLQNVRTIAISGGATGTATSFNGSTNITIPVTDLNATNLSSGTVPSARLSGAYTSITGVGTLTGLTVSSASVDHTRSLGAGGGYYFESRSGSGSGYSVWYRSGTDTHLYDSTSGTNRLTISGTSITSPGVSEFSNGGTPTGDGAGVIRGSSSATQTGITIKSSASSGQTDFFMAFYDTANGSSAVGSIYSNPSTSTTVFLTTSDYRLKRDDAPLLGSLNRIMALRPISYRWSRFTDSPVEEGFFAHEVQEVVPCAVFGEKDAEDDDGNMVVQQMELSRLVPVLVGAVQELAARVAALETPL
jgi:hypothetical protein